MKILDRGLAGSGAAEAGKTQEIVRAERDTAERTGSSRHSGSSDRAEVSSLAGRVSSALASSSETRASQVSKLASLYRSGAYHADPAAVSRAVVAETLSASATSRAGQ
jgi:anti-sigma28 factor (negative regulator of flagellin synthesis)